MELYNASIGGDVSKFKELIEIKKYSIMEECSASGFYWTALHYAAHYGHSNIILYYTEYLKNNPNKIDMMNLQSNLGLSPLYISLSNHSININEKKKILEMYAKNELLDYSMCNKEGLDVFSLCKKQNLLEHFLTLLKED
jgi:hypothetical protein